MNPVSRASMPRLDKALSTPLLNPGVLDVLPDLVTFARVGGYGFHATLHSDAGDVQYRMDKTGNTVEARGTLNGQPFVEHWQTDAVADTVVGSIGSDKESLSIGKADDTSVDGNVGAVPVHEDVTFDDDEQDPHEVLDGKIGGQSLHLAIHHPITQPFWPGAYHAEGTFGSAPVVIDQKTTNVGDKTFTIAGEGHFGDRTTTWSMDVVEDT
ncbi:MAG: hypothetical protein ACYCW6_25835 [Candidatus Xenobia bacterium]